MRRFRPTAARDGTIDVFDLLEACRYPCQLNTADIWNGLLSGEVQVQLDVERLKEIRQAMDEQFDFIVGAFCEVAARACDLGLKVGPANHSERPTSRTTC